MKHLFVLILTTLLFAGLKSEAAGQTILNIASADCERAKNEVDAHLSHYKDVVASYEDEIQVYQMLISTNQEILAQMNEQQDMLNLQMKSIADFQTLSRTYAASEGERKAAFLRLRDRFSDPSITMLLQMMSRKSKTKTDRKVAELLLQVMKVSEGSALQLLDEAEASNLLSDLATEISQNQAFVTQLRSNNERTSSQINTSLELSSQRMAQLSVKIKQANTTIATLEARKSCNP